MEDKLTLGKFIQQKRRENNLSQRELAEKLFVTESAVSKWERGISYPDITMVSGICSALGISEHELFIAGEDLNRRRIEQMAVKYKRFVLIYSLIFAAGYLSALIPCFFVFVVKEHSPCKFFILLTSLMLTASVVNVPVLADRNKGLAVLGSGWLSLNLLMLSGCIYSGGDWFIMAFLSVLMSFSVVFLPFVVRSQLFEPYTGKNKALICMAADTVLILAEIAYGTLKYGSWTAFYSAMLSAVWCLMLVWTVFAIIRYVKCAPMFKLSLSTAAVSLFSLLANPVLGALINGTSFNYELSEQYAVNRFSLVLFLLSLAFSAVGAVIAKRKSN
ncbi:MAG: helix-turn-helix domain-containing protein [Ruminococcus sp.]